MGSIYKNVYYNRLQHRQPDKKNMRWKSLFIWNSRKNKLIYSDRRQVQCGLFEDLCSGWSNPGRGSVQFSHSVMSDSLRPHEPQHASPPCPSPTPRVHPNPCPSSWWCHPAILTTVIPFYYCPQSFPAAGSFPMSQLSASGGQSIGVSASASVLPMNTQDWSPLEWTGWIYLQSKGLSRVFSNTTVQKHQFFGAQLSW